MYLARCINEISDTYSTRSFKKFQLYFKFTVLFCKLASIIYKCSISKSGTKGIIN